jgi:hypothetical protein
MPEGARVQIWAIQRKQARGMEAKIPVSRKVAPGIFRDRSWAVAQRGIQGREAWNWVKGAGLPARAPQQRYSPLHICDKDLGHRQTHHCKSSERQNKQDLIFRVQEQAGVW